MFIWYNVYKTYWLWNTRMCIYTYMYNADSDCTVSTISSRRCWSELGVALRSERHFPFNLRPLWRTLEAAAAAQRVQTHIQTYIVQCRVPMSDRPLPPLSLSLCLGRGHYYTLTSSSANLSTCPIFFSLVSCTTLGNCIACITLRFGMKKRC